MPIMYPEGTALPAGPVPCTVLILTKDEEVNIARCIRSVSWADQIIVIDSGSTDGTVPLASAQGAEVVETHWRGFGPQRDWAMDLNQIRNEWIYFVDADEWISGPLADEIAEVVRSPAHDAYSQQFRLVFQGRWIRHCGWYPSVLYTRLLKRGRAAYGYQPFSEHPRVDGTVGLLENDLVDEDLKGLARWLHKHVDYAEIEAGRRLDPAPRDPRRNSSRLQAFLKDSVAPRVPGRPLAQFFYMYVLRLGFLDGAQGLRFCFLHAWFQMVVDALMDERRRAEHRGE